MLTYVKTMSDFEVNASRPGQIWTDDLNTDLHGNPISMEEKWDDHLMRRVMMAPRKRITNLKLTYFLHENKRYMKKQVVMPSELICHYLFDKKQRVVTLYITESGEPHSLEDPCLVLTAKDWFLFYNHAWADVRESKQEPLFIAEWDSEKPNNRFRLVGNNCEKNPEDCIYIFLCDDKSKLRERSGIIHADEHNEQYEMVLPILWRDVDKMDDIFRTINKLFKWCDLNDRYRNIKVQLFHPQRMGGTISCCSLCSSACVVPERSRGFDLSSRGSVWMRSSGFFSQLFPASRGRLFGFSESHSAMDGGSCLDSRASAQA